MPIFSKLAIGDILQFPSGALKKLVKTHKDTFVFSTVKNGKKRMKYTLDFVTAFCDLMPKDIDVQYFLNTSHLRKIINIEAKSILNSDSSILIGYFIEDEMIDPPPIEEED